MYLDRVLEPSPLICSISAGQDAGGGGAPVATPSDATGAASGREAGAPANGHEPAQPFTADALREMLRSELKSQEQAYEKRFKKLNDELARYRVGARTEREGTGTEAPSPVEKPAGSLTREDVRAEMAYERTIAQLEAELPAEALEEFREQAERLPLDARLEAAKALRRGLELGRGGKTRVAGDREVGTPQNRTKRGMAEAPAPRSSGVRLPESWEEYASLPKSDPQRKAALDKLPPSEFDPTELYARRTPSIKRRSFIPGVP